MVFATSFFVKYFLVLYCSSNATLCSNESILNDASALSNTTYTPSPTPSQCIYLLRHADIPETRPSPCKNFGLHEIKINSYKFGTELMKVFENQAGNVVVPPISLMMLLSLLTTGADRHTKVDIYESMNYPGFIDPEPPLKEETRELWKQLNVDSTDLTISTHMEWADELDLDSNFIDDGRSRFHMTTMRNSPPNGGERGIFNEYTVQVNISGKLHDLVKGVTSFEGHWQSPFDPTTTTGGVMHQINLFTHGESNRFKFIQLPYKTDGDVRASMLVVIPTNGSTLQEMVTDLKRFSYSDLRNISKSEIVQLFIPKIELDSTLELGSSQGDLPFIRIFGEKSIFEGESVFANFSKILKDQPPIHIKTIRARNRFILNEQGSSNKPAMTPKPFSRTGEVPNFDVKPPFIALIIINDVNVFSAIISDTK